MCVKPVLIEVEGRPQEVACRHCWMCRKTRVDDYAGRCLAEAQTSEGVSVLTLTYAGDVPGSVILLMSDVQKLWKRLRRRGYPLRYIVAGEHGSRHGRAHWHTVIFWQKAVPQGIPYDEFGEWEFWPHGHVHGGKFDLAWLRYQLKYVLKDFDQEIQVSRFAYSRLPPLGRDWFYSRADDLVERRAIPATLVYTFPGVVDRHGVPVKFRLRRRMAELFLDRWSISWRLRWGEEPPYGSWLEEHYHDKIETDLKEQRDVMAYFGGLTAQNEDGEAGEFASSGFTRPPTARDDIAALYRAWHSDPVAASALWDKLYRTTQGASLVSQGNADGRWGGYWVASDLDPDAAILPG